MTEAYVKNVYDFPTVVNVCNQVLREAIKLPDVSMAHVTMEAGNVSFLHRHDKMRELYYILNGKGILYHGDKALSVGKNAYLDIPPGTPHKLRNTGGTELEHLVFAAPPFDPQDVILLDEAERKEPSVEIFVSDAIPIEAQDGAVVYELMTEEEREAIGIGLASGSLPPKRKATPHFHKKSNEVYYVIGGRGKVRLGDSFHDVKKGVFVYVPVNMVHGLENLSEDQELEVLCLSSPFYTDEDFIIR